MSEGVEGSSGGSVNGSVVELAGLHDWPVDVPTHLAPLYATLEILCAVLAIIGNSLVLYVYFTQRSLRTVKNAYVVSLGTADLAVGLIGIPAALATSVGLPLQFEFCIVMNSILLILCTASISSLVAVTIDRLWAITRPLTYIISMTTRRARITIGVCWTIAVLIGMLPLIGWHAGRPPVPRCFFAEVMAGGYLVFIFIGTIITPSVFMAVVYCIIYHSIKEQGRALQSIRRNLSNPGSNPVRSTAERSEVESESRSEAVRDTDRYTDRDTDRDTDRETDRGTDRETDRDREMERNVDEESQSKTTVNNRATTTTTTPRTTARSTSQTVNGRLNKLEQEQLKRQKRQQLQTESRAAQSVAILVIVFLISWLPLYILNTIDWFCGATSGRFETQPEIILTSLTSPDSYLTSLTAPYSILPPSTTTLPPSEEDRDGYCRPPVLAFNIAILLSHYNSVWNPLLYAWGMRDIRRELRKLLFKQSREREQLLTNR